MELIDLYYRAFKEYRDKTKNNKVAEKELEELIKSMDENNSFKSKKFLCTISEDWVSKIETELEFVTKAVDEQRQFIISQGEVVEISKVRKVSKDSVAHLAKHANMITHLPEDGAGDDVVPDKLYMVEKLADFAIYENRFLYMCLMYAKNFIEYRLKKINELHRTYVADLIMKVNSKSKERKFDFDLTIHDERYDNPYPVKDSSCEAMIKRIVDCQTIIDGLLNTDLMVQVAKAPMLKPPITKTNVLKMNNNFKRSLSLYDFLAGYTTPGYTYEEVIYDVYPLTDYRAKAIAEVTNSFRAIEYEFGNDITSVLEENYQKQLELERLEASKKALEQLARLKKAALESNKSLEEYMLVLEKRNKILEKQNEQLAILKKEIEDLQETINGLNDQIDSLNRDIEKLQLQLEEKIKEIDRLNQKYIDDITALKNAHAEEVATMVRVHNEEVNALNTDYTNQIKALSKSYESQIDELNEKYDTDMANIKQEYAHDRATLITDYESKIESLDNEIIEINNAKKAMQEDFDSKLIDVNTRLDQAIEDKVRAIRLADEQVRNMEIEFHNQSELLLKETNAKVTKAEKEKTFAMAQLHAIQIDSGLMQPGEEYSTKEEFNQLFAEYQSFEKFLTEQWDITKKEIKKRVFNAQAQQYEDSKKGK